VRFAFGHRVEALRLGEDGAEVAAIELCRTAGADEDEPLVRVGGLPCFPSEPPVEAPDEEDVVLALGEDFDAVVLAISLGALPDVCGELLERSARWRAMVAHVATVPTQSLQLWLSEDEAALGWPYPGATVSGYVTPFDTYASMSHLIECEAWPEGAEPRAIGYFCSALPAAAADDPAAAHALVGENAEAHLARFARDFWPGFAPEHVLARYWRANVDASDRYVQSLPGSAAHRLRADGSGFANLFLAGDWIDCGLNAGCIEAAVMAGLQAANAVRGRPLTDGLGGTWYGLEDAA
jgi:uncharacterized protein with NAD-binding domain and iron-sulfur cluster